MRYIVDSNNYVTAISFGTEIVYNDCVCVEYTGMVPSGWDSLEAWYFDEGDKLWRWQIIDGELTMDAYATAPEEGDWTQPDLQYKSVNSATYTQYVEPDEGYDGLSGVTVYGMSTRTLSTPSISVDEGGKITASITQSSGYVNGTTKTKTHTLSAADDPDFVEANIRSGITLFGLAGGMMSSFITEFYTDGDHYSTKYNVDIEDERLTKLPDKLLIVPDYDGAFSWLSLELSADGYYTGQKCIFGTETVSNVTATYSFSAGSYLRLAGQGFTGGCTFIVACIYN